MKGYYSPLKAGHESKYDDKPRMELLECVTGDCKRVLEVGCGTGATGALVKQTFPGAWYAGLEIDEKAADIARARLDQVITGNLETLDIEKAGLSRESFDLIICADVLEHLYDPWKALHRLRDFLRPGGKVLASIPNTQNIHLIQHLAAGHWTYSDFGLLDATHIRFFTLGEIVKLFHGTGYTIINCGNRLEAPIEKEGWPRDLDYGQLVLRNVSFEDANKLFTIQYLILAQKNEQ
jgi:2-polyprenyl-3-methyl-5-hydroxy-6-metoxy-1,4-benzoquinol methylase